MVYNICSNAVRLIHLDTLGFGRHCGWIQSLKGAGECLKGGVGCATDIAGEEETVGLDTVETVAQCVSAVKDCTDFFEDCF